MSTGMANTINIGTASASATGVLVPSGVGGTGSIDTSQTDWLAVQIGGTFTGGFVAAEGSYDGGTTWASIPMLTSTGGFVTSYPSPGIYTAQTLAPITRLRVAAISTGTIVLLGGTTDVTNSPVVNPSAGTLTVTNTPATATPFNLTTAATTNATSVKTSAGNLYELDCSNTSASTVWLKLYNKASAPTVGTDVPLLTIPIATGAAFVQSFGSTGKRFGTGFAFALTGAQVSTDATAIAAGVLVSGNYL